MSSECVIIDAEMLVKPQHGSMITGLEPTVVDVVTNNSWLTLVQIKRLGIHLFLENEGINLFLCQNTVTMLLSRFNK